MIGRAQISRSKPRQVVPVKRYVRWMSVVPKKMRRLYWPGKVASTIPAAVRWFNETHGVPPQLIVSKSKSWRVVQDIRLWAKDAPDSTELYFQESYGKVAGTARYQEAVHLVLMKRKAPMGSKKGRK